MVQWLKSSANGGPNRPYQMVLMDDQTIIMIPLSILSNITYTAKTLGVKSQCVTYIDVFLKVLRSALTHCSRSDTIHHDVHTQLEARLDPGVNMNPTGLDGQ